MTTETGTQTVPPAAPSTGEVAPAQTTLEVTTSAHGPSTDEAKIAELVKAEVAKATEAARREIQSIKDKSVAEVSRHAQRATIADASVRATIESLRQSDPTAATELENRVLRTERDERAREEQQRAQAEAIQEIRAEFRTTMEDAVREMGLDPSDKGIDWGDDAPTPAAAQKRIIASAKAIKKGKETQVASPKVDVKGLQDQIAALTKEIASLKGENNSVDTSAPSGTPSGPSAEAKFMKDFAEGNVPMTKDNLARYNKIVSAY